MTLDEGKIEKLIKNMLDDRFKGFMEGIQDQLTQSQANNYAKFALFYNFS